MKQLNSILFRKINTGKKALLFLSCWFRSELRAMSNKVLLLDFSSNQKLLQLQKTGEVDMPGSAHNKKRWHRMLLRYYFALKLTKGKSVLDTCCGCGWGSYLLSYNSTQVVGIDMNQDLIDFADSNWNNANLSFQQNDIMSLTFPDNSFDIAVGMESIEHFTKDDGEKYIREVARVIKPGGHLILSSHFANTSEEAISVCSKVPAHLHIWTKEDINNLISHFFSHVSFFDSTLLTAYSKKQHAISNC